MKFPSFILLPFLICSVAAQTPPRNENTVVLDAAGVNNLGIETIAVSEGTFTKSVKALGRLEVIPENRSVLSSRISGRIIESDLRIGQYVEKGMELVLLESRQPGDPPPSIWLKAPANGTILGVNAVLGSPVEPTDVLCEIAELKEMYAVATVSQSIAGEIKQGTEADIVFPIKPEQKIRGTLLKFAPCPCPDSSCALGQNLSKRDDDEHDAANTAGIIFTIKNPDNQLRPGMNAQFTIILQERKNVMSIPREALQGDRSNRFVFIKDYELENAFVRVPITIGEIDDKNVEILSGLLPGDEVVLKGSYSLSFAGKGSASLKEALDAAHGHPHKEDGTEMTKEEIAAKGSSSGKDHDHAHGSTSKVVIFLSIACGVLLLLLIISTLSHKLKSQPVP